MGLSTAVENAAHLVHQYGTHDPFELTEYVGAEVYFADLGELKGMYTDIQNHRFLVINNQLDEDTARIVCAHELGHDQLHRSLVSSAFLSETDLFNPADRTEYEANQFAAELLLPDDTVIQMAQEGMTIDEIAANTRTDVNLVALKLKTLSRRGFTLNEFDYRSDFLKFGR